MIGGASQADVGVLVISARKGEYETGFEKGGQTREHAMLAKTQGVNKILIVVNKMDDPTVEWSEDRFKECTTKVVAFLKGLGYNPKTDISMMPVSAQTFTGIKTRVPKVSNFFLVSVEWIWTDLVGRTWPHGTMARLYLSTSTTCKRSSVSSMRPS